MRTYRYYILIIMFVALIVFFFSLEWKSIESDIIYGTATIYCAGGTVPLSNKIDENAMIIYDYGILPRDVYHLVDGNYSFKFKGDGEIIVFFDLEIAGYKTVDGPGEYNLSIIDCVGLR